MLQLLAYKAAVRRLEGKLGRRQSSPILNQDVKNVLHAVEEDFDALRNNHLQYLSNKEDSRTLIPPKCVAHSPDQTLSNRQNVSLRRQP